MCGLRTDYYTGTKNYKLYYLETGNISFLVSARNGRDVKNTWFRCKEAFSTPALILLSCLTEIQLLKVWADHYSLRLDVQEWKLNKSFFHEKKLKKKKKFPRKKN